MSQSRDHDRDQVQKRTSTKFKKYLSPLACSLAEALKGARAASWSRSYLCCPRKECLLRQTPAEKARQGASSKAVQSKSKGPRAAADTLRCMPRAVQFFTKGAVCKHETCTLRLMQNQVGTRSADRHRRTATAAAHYRKGRPYRESSVQGKARRAGKNVSAEADASNVSDDLVFFEIDLHRQLMLKLKINGMNAAF